MITLAEIGSASNAAIGQWVMIALALASGMGAILGVASYFATRREVEKLDTRITKLEENDTTLQNKMQEIKDDLIHSGDRRSSVLHNRINPMVETLAALKASSEAFVTSFNNFTRIIDSRERKDRH